MIKLNGNIYLKDIEIERYVTDVARRFKTSHRAILPQQINYLDREFVIAIQDEAKNLSLWCSSYLFGYSEEFVSIKKAIQAIHDRFRPEEQCSNKLYFMQYDLTDSQRNKYRKQYENFIVNVFLDECIKKLESLS